MPSVAERYVEDKYETSVFPALRAGKMGRPESLTVAGALSLETSHTDLAIDDASDVAFTLAAGEEGQTKTIVMSAKGDAGNAVVTPTGGIDAGTTITFDTVGDFAMLQYLGGKWRSIKATATIA